MIRAGAIFLVSAGVLAVPAAGLANGYGADPDGDSNPAVNTRLEVLIGDPAEAALAPPWSIITFEAPPGAHGDTIARAYEADYGVRFAPAVTRQVCEGQRYFRYDSVCTYRRAPSGRYAALHKDDWNRPLQLHFREPVCAASLSLYPTGGKEGQRFRVTLQAYDADGGKIERRRFTFRWTQHTFRWRLSAASYFLDDAKKASRIDVSIEARDELDFGLDIDPELLGMTTAEAPGASGPFGSPYKGVSFLIDDVATITEGCELLLDDVAAETEIARSSATVILAAQR